MKKAPSAYNRSIIRIGATFAVSLGLRIYLVGVLFGGWLDRRWETAPLCLLLGVLLAIFSSFYFLFRDLNSIEEPPPPPKDGVPPKTVREEPPSGNKEEEDSSWGAPDTRLPWEPWQETAQKEDIKPRDD